MCNFRLTTIFFSGLILLACVSAMAETPLTAQDWIEKEKELQIWCQQEPLSDEAKVFSDTLTKSKQIRADYCSKKYSTLFELQMHIVDLLGDLNRIFPSGGIYLQMQLAESANIKRTGEIALFDLLPEYDDNDNLLSLEISLDDPDYKVESALLVSCNQATKAISPAMDCQSALEEFAEIYNFAQGTYAQPLAFELSKRLDLLETRWNTFYEESKSQMFWEMIANGILFQRKNEAYKFSEPPSWQLVLMHPSVVVENVADAIDGDQFKEAIMIEAIGADWWQQDKWYMPSGGALIATYSDRLDVDDWGYGVALHFRSKFTIGVSEHGDDRGVFMTIDLMRLIQDKKKTIESYRGVIPAKAENQ